MRPTNPASRNGFQPQQRAEHLGSSRNHNVSVGDYETNSSQQPLKRTLPQAFSQPPFPHRPDNATQFRGDYATSAGNNSSTGDHYGGVLDDLGVGRVINGNRILPASLAHGTSASSSSHYNGFSDPMHRNGIAEDRNTGNDERLIYQAALQVFILLSTFDLCDSHLSFPFVLPSFTVSQLRDLYQNI